MRNVFRESIRNGLIYGVLYVIGFLLGYGVEWLLTDFPDKIEERKKRRYIEIDLGNDEDVEF